MLRRLINWIFRRPLISDLLITLICLYAASVLRRLLAIGRPILPEQTTFPASLYVGVIVIWSFAFLLASPRRGTEQTHLPEELGGVLTALAIAVPSLAMLLYLTLRDLSRLQFVYFTALDCVALLFNHVYQSSLRRSGDERAAVRKVLLVASTRPDLLVADLKALNDSSISLVGFTCASPPGDVDPLFRGDIKATPDVVVAEAVDEIIFALDPEHQDQLLSLAWQLADSVVLHMTPSVVDLSLGTRPLRTVGGIPVINLRGSALTRRQRWLKRGFDIVASSFLLMLFAPLVILIALLIKVESEGPVFFAQDRVAEHGRWFKMLKFRSMRRDHQRNRLLIGTNVPHKTSDDPRITRVGRFLRRSSLDELPQLFNVLRGDMSLVGPRPELPFIVARYEHWQWQRFQVPAGMTGWWQINGRSTRPMHLHTADDLYYVNNYSFLLDLKILLMTIFVVLRGKGAF